MLSNSFPRFPYSSPSRPGGRSWDVVRCKAAKISEEYKSSNDIQGQDGNLLLECFPQIWIASKTSLALGRNFRLSLVDNSGVHSIPEKKNDKRCVKFWFSRNSENDLSHNGANNFKYRKWSIKRRGAYFISSVIGAVLIPERRLFQLRVKHWGEYREN